MNLRLYAALQGFAAILLVGCAPGTVPPADPPATDEALIHAALSSLLTADRWYDTLLVHQDRGGRPWQQSTIDYLRREGMSLTPRLIESFAAANTTASPSSDFEIRLSEARWLSPLEAELVGGGREGWEELRAQAGDVAVVWFSGVGVDSDAGIAAVSYTFRCGPLECAEGHVLLLRATEAGWAVEQDVLEWIS